MGSHISEGRSAGVLVLEEIGYGVIGGVAAGLLIGAVIVHAGRRDLIDGAWRQVIPAAGALLAYGTADALGGSGFIAIGMLGTHARPPTLAFLGWFGPRGLASIVFAVIVIEESQLPHEHLIVLAIYVTVGLSVFAHGLTATPLANRYARWFESHPRDEAPPIESAPTQVTRTRALVGSSGPAAGQG